ncbi:hypothetical protein Avbf_00420 [Armadillidium vulgare]|nr:hypothetical protein Avbf_00420 [Armadillidium vulgare]
MKYIAIKEVRIIFFSEYHTKQHPGCPIFAPTTSPFGSKFSLKLEFVSSKVGILDERFTCCGIFLGIILFPLGLICCFLMRRRQCTNCGASF